MESAEKDSSFEDLLCRLRDVHDSELSKLLSKIKILEEKSKEPPMLDPPDVSLATPVTAEPVPALLFGSEDQAAVKAEVALATAVTSEREPDTLLTSLASKPVIQKLSSRLWPVKEMSGNSRAMYSSEGNGRGPQGRRATVTPDHVRNRFKELEVKNKQVMPRSIALKLLEVFVAIAIVLNSIMIGVEVSWRSDQTESSCDSNDALQVLNGINSFFFALFLIDLLVRIGLEGKEFIFSAAWKWNIFDCVVVLAMLIDQFIPKCNTPAEIKSPSMLRTFRLVRVLRVFKIFTQLKQLREFSVVVQALTRSLLTLASCFGAIATMLYICAILLTNSNLDHCNQVDNLSSVLCEHFGTLGGSIISLYAVTLGGIHWYPIMQALWASSVVDFVTFFFYVTFSLLIVLNTITAMLVVKEQGFSEERKKLFLKEDQKREQTQMVELLQRIFRDLDTNANKGISRNEFTRAFDDVKGRPEFTAWLTYFDLGGTRPEVLFDLIDMNGDGEITLREFAAGCYWLKGAAKNIDSIKILNDIEDIRYQISNLTGQDVDGDEECHVPHEFKSADDQDLALRRLSLSSGAELQGIKAPEDRAMTLTELQQVRATIQAKCISKSWVEEHTRSMLRPESVDLYSLCYNFIAPVTVPDGIFLKGLKRDAYEEGQTVVQFHPDSGSPPFAEGKIMTTCNDCTLHVKVTRGRFVPHGGVVSVVDVERGVPAEVESKTSWSYKEVISRTPTKPLWYCCHWWGEQVIKFVQLCEVHAQYYDLKPAQATFWICAYANNQHTLSDEIGSSPEDSSFRRAMLAADRVLLVLDPTARAFSRIWCSYELYKTICDKDRRLDIMTVKDQGDPALISEELLPKEELFEKTHREQQFPVQLLARGLQSKLEDGHASVQDDKDRILQVIENDGRKDGGDEEGARARALAHANSLLNSYIALRAWPFAVKNRIIHDFDATWPGTISLVDVLKHDTARTDVTLSLAHCRANDEDVQAVGHALPEQLTYVYLSFEDCLASDVGVCNLVMCLPGNLQKISLDFSGCTSITDVTLKCLGVNMPPKVEHLRLCFANCGEGITKEGAHLLASSLQRLSQLKGFSANFIGTGLNSEYTSLQKFKALLEPGFLSSMLPGQLDMTALDNM